MEAMTMTWLTRGAATLGALLALSGVSLGGGAEVASAAACPLGGLAGAGQISCEFPCEANKRIAITVTRTAGLGEVTGHVRCGDTFVPGRGNQVKCGVHAGVAAGGGFNPFDICVSWRGVGATPFGPEGNCRGASDPGTNLHIQCVSLLPPDNIPGAKYYACNLVPGQVAGSAGADSLAADVSSGDGWDPLRLLDVDSGGFTFSGNVACAGTAYTDIARLDAMGTYHSLFCGTMDMYGSATLTAPGVALQSELAATFVSGRGPLMFSGWSGTVGGENVGPEGADGYLEAVPASNVGGGNCVNQDVTQFFLNGSWAGALPEETGM
jgi:hypothetical protein